MANGVNNKMAGIIRLHTDITGPLFAKLGKAGKHDDYGDLMF